jgi:hypothetical protein
MSQHGVVQTQAPVRLDDVMIDSPNPPIYFNSTANGVGSINLAANTTYRIGTLMAYNASSNKYVPFLDGDPNAGVPDCVLMSEIVTTGAGDYQGLLAKGVVRRKWLVSGAAGFVGDAFNNTPLSALAVTLARNRGLFIQNVS